MFSRILASNWLGPMILSNYKLGEELFSNVLSGKFLELIEL